MEGVHCLENGVNTPDDRGDSDTVKDVTTIARKRGIPQPRDVRFPTRFA